MIGYHKGGHGFTNGHRADADARVMTAFGDNFCFIAANVDFDQLNPPPIADIAN